MKRTLLLCFIHGFKGDGETFYTFPQSLKKHVAEKLPDDDVELLLYPKYETRGSLLDSTDKFLEWLKGKVMEIRKEKTQNPWPPNDRSVGVILVAHSMGGFVASDALFSILNDHHDQEEKDTNHVIFPLIQGILAFDTPYNGLARSMFVYGAFSQYNKVSNIWNIMSAASAGLISARSLTTMSAKQAARQAGSSMVATTRTASPGWKIWEGIAVKSGVVGAIAAGGVAAYRNRETIIAGVKNLNKNSIKEGAEQGYDALGQGLAYINRDSVGQSFAWLSSHLKFVGALMRQKEMVQRLERLSKVEGIGIRNFYTSLGENGYWSGGYFVPERTFCAIPAPGQKSHELFIRSVNGAVEDEVHAHMSMFKPETHDNYDKMSQQARDLVVEWFQSDNKVVDIPPLPELLPETAPEKDATGVQTEEGEIFTGTESESVPNLDMDGVDESPLDIVAAAAAIPLPDIQENDLDGKQRESYLQSLYRISQRAGSGLTGVASTGLKAGAAIPGFASKGVSSLWSSSKSKLESEASTNVEELSESMTIDADDDVRNEDKKGSVWAFRSFFPSRTKKDEKVDDNEDGRMDESKVDNHRTQLE